MLSRFMRNNSRKVANTVLNPDGSIYRSSGARAWQGTKKIWNAADAEVQAEVIAGGLSIPPTVAYVHHRDKKKANQLGMSMHDYHQLQRKQWKARHHFF